MPICEKRKLAFCHIPRTGGVSLSLGLGLTVMDYHYPASWYRRHYPDYYLFTVLRPYDDRIKSTFGYKVPKIYKDYNFENLIKEKYEKGERNYGLMLKPNEYFMDAEFDCTLRFSHLNSDLNKMLRNLNLPEVNLEPCNSFK